MKQLHVVPLTLDEANAYVELHHAHSKPVQGHKFSIGATDGEEIVGVVIVGRPVAQFLQDGWTLEVRRVCTNGHKNAASFLYGAARKACFSLGYRRVITYTTQAEKGVSLIAAGYAIVGQRDRSEKWHRRARPRVTKHEPQQTFRWACDAP